MANKHDESPSPVVMCPSSPNDISSHHSALTNSTEDNENFISLLQYKNAHHILNLHTPDSQSPNDALSQETINEAYNVAKQQALYALEQFEATHKTGKKNMFFYSQQNFLELKLQALDQAYEELGGIIERDDNNTPPPRQSRKDEKDGKTSSDAPSISAKKTQVEDSTADPQTKLQDDNIGDCENAYEFDTKDKAAKTTPPRQLPQQEKQVTPQHKREQSDDDDELDTIDIYFQPSPKKDRVSKEGIVEKASDASSVTWDDNSIGASIFSMLSVAADAVSESGLSEVLGPKSVTEKEEEKELNEVLQNNSSNRRPPSGINVKHRNAKKSAQISPKSVTDWKVSIHNNSSYDNSSPRKSNSAALGRGRMMKGARQSNPMVNTHDATEAARMGILRALSEDNSECLQIDDEYTNNNYLNRSDETNGTEAVEAKARFMKRHYGKGRNSGGGGTSPSKARPKNFFQGKSDRMPKDTNSLLSSQLSGRQISEEYPTESTRSYESSTRQEQATRDNTVSIAAVENASDKPTLNRKGSSGSSQEHRKHKGSRPSSPPTTILKTTSKSSRNKRKDETTEYKYDDILLAGMEMADELCMSLNNCLNPPTDDIGFVKKISNASSAAILAAQCELERNGRQSDQSLEEDSTFYSRSTYDDTRVTYGDTSTYFTRRSEYTDGESTAFDTTSSFSKKNGKRNSSRETDPPQRMMV